MVARGILFILLSVVFVYCYRFAIAGWKRHKAKKSDEEAGEIQLPSDIHFPTWGSTADLVTTRLSAYDIYSYDAYGPPHPPPPRSRNASHSSNSCRRASHGVTCEECHPSGELRLGRRTRGVIRELEGIASDPDLPKYTADPTSSCPALVADDQFPPPPTPPPEAYVLEGHDGTDLTAVVSRITAVDRERRESEQRESEQRGSQQRQSSPQSSPSHDSHDSGSDSDHSARESESSGSAESVITPPPPTTGRRWSFRHGSMSKPTRPPVNMASTFSVMMPL